jgi:hypothetical protein
MVILMTINVFVHAWTISCNSQHLDWRKSDRILKGDHIRIIPTKFGLIQLSGLKGVELNAIFYLNMSNLHNQSKHLNKIFHRKTWNIC